MLALQANAGSTSYIAHKELPYVRILTINLSIDSALTALGHEVHSVTLPAGIHALHTQAGVRHFQPELLIQQEVLGDAVLLVDVASFACPKAFWSLDTHINLFWHRYYGRLFDCFLTPHLDFCAEAPAHWQHPYTCRLPFAALPMPWRPHAARSHSLNFVGRITPQRPLRQRAIQFLQQRYVMGLYQDIPRGEMMDLYADTRILPNETIAFESNFRLLEGASSGCCLISPHIGADQDAVLAPGKEVLIYNDALECMELIDLCLRKPRMAEAVGRMAWERVQAEHLPEHRAVQLLQAVAKAPACALRDVEAHEQVWASAAELELAGTFIGEGKKSLWDRDVYGTATTLALRLRWARQRQNMPQCKALLQEALHILPQSPLSTTAGTTPQGGQAPEQAPSVAMPLVPQDCAQAMHMAECAAVMGLYCLQVGDMAQACRLWQSFCHCLGEVPPRHLHADNPEAQASDLALLWAKKLYASHGHWYMALEFLTFLPNLTKLDNGWAEQMLGLRPVVRHFPLLALSALARLSLNNPDDIALHAAYIATNIRCFRIQEAQEELTLLMSRWAGSPAEDACTAALRAQCANIQRLDAALQPFA